MRNLCVTYPLLFTLTFITFVATTRYWSAEDDEELEVLQLADCEFQLEPIGCYTDIPGYDRALPDQILNGRDKTSKTYLSPKIQWKNYNHWLANFICKGAKKLFESKPDALTDYLGVQFYGEIWANLDPKLKMEYLEYGKHGASSACVNGDFKDITKGHVPKTCGIFTGKGNTNYVYKVTRYNNETAKTCPYFESSGCWKDGHNRGPDVSVYPMAKYAMNERDRYASNWNGKMVDWGKWGEGYLGDLLCRCAIKAKEEDMKYFSIQYYGECWLSNDKHRHEKYGKTSHCVNNKWKVCKMDQGAKCRAQQCAGKQEANKVYELKQGPHKCSTSPCKNNGKCLTIGNHDYVCKCKGDFKGTHCDEKDDEDIFTK